jgi:hypothetical protein
MMRGIGEGFNSSARLPDHLNPEPGIVGIVVRGAHCGVETAVAGFDLGPEERRVGFGGCLISNKSWG